MAISRPFHAVHVPSLIAVLSMLDDIDHMSQNKINMMFMPRSTAPRHWRYRCAKDWKPPS